eukprot:scaffold51100_cov61-Phaeocystis_antarctica.AAC.3
MQCDGLLQLSCPALSAWPFAYRSLARFGVSYFSVRLNSRAAPVPAMPKEPVAAALARLCKAQAKCAKELNALSNSHAASSE